MTEGVERRAAPASDMPLPHRNGIRPQAGFPLELAGRAANYAERMRVVAAMEAVPSADCTALDAFDRWKIGRSAERLAAMFRTDPLHRGEMTRHVVEEIAAALTVYRRHELNQDGRSERMKALLAEIHQDWLPTYQAALERFGPALDTFEGFRRREADTHYGRLAKACEPFLLELGRELCPGPVGERSRCERGQRPRYAGGVPARPARLSPTLVEALQEHLLRRFELALAWAVETDAKVHCAERGIDRAQATRADYLCYLDATFADAAAYHRFYSRFPVLGRWLAHVTRLLADFGRELFTRLTSDAAELSEVLFGQPISEFRSLDPGRSDHHAGARSVTFVEAVLADGETGTFVYKPRSVAAEAAMQELLGLLAADQVIDFASRTVLAKDGYGYEAVIPTGHNRVASRSEAERIYQELGGHLAIFYVLGGSDLHFENVMVADGHAFVCDCETAFAVIPEGCDRSRGTLLDSVFKTGLLEWPRADSPGADTLAEMRISGYAGGEAYRLPIAVPRADDERMTFQAGVTHRRGVRVELDASNRLYLNDELLRPEGFIESITNGFERVYEWFRQRPDEAVRRISRIFAEAPVRFVNRSTQDYAQLLLSARHPKYLMDPLQVDVLANTVRTSPRTWGGEGILAERELQSMWRMDIPVFTAALQGDRLIHDYRTVLPSPLDVSPIDHAAERIRGLSVHDRRQQTRYIAASLSIDEVSAPSFVAACLDNACRIGDRLCEMLSAPGASAPWTSHDVTSGRITEVESDLYNGSAGIALFLAYLDRLAPRPMFRRAAGRALDHAIAHCDQQRIGVFDGIGGLIYVLVHLHHLWRDDQLIQRAVRLSRELASLIDEDRCFDVLGGCAGLVPVLLGLARASDGDGLDTAGRCADHLLHNAESHGETLSWPPGGPDEASMNLTGFAHGAAGIGWALICLGQAVNRSEYVEAGRSAFAYEARHFDTVEQDWYDLRRSGGGIRRGNRFYANAWCNGAAGIALSRLACWAALGKTDESMLREAYQGLAATIRNFPRLTNDTLCHGRSGNAELLLRFSLLCDEPAYRLEANVQVRTQWRNLGDAESGTSAGLAGTGILPGLMLGLSGFGMHFLRLAAPERVPSALLLDHPPEAEARAPSDFPFGHGPPPEPSEP